MTQPVENLGIAAEAVLPETLVIDFRKLIALQ
jgi:hypothetical protein